MVKTTSKSIATNFRPHQRELIDKACELTAVNPCAFLRSAAVMKAKQILKEEEIS